MTKNQKKHRPYTRVTQELLDSMRLMQSLPQATIAQLMHTSQSTVARAVAANYDLPTYRRQVKEIYANYHARKAAKMEAEVAVAPTGVSRIKSSFFPTFGRRPGQITRPKNVVDQDLLDRLENDYTYHAPKDDQPERYEKMRSACHQLAILVATLSPKSREQSMALSHLEQVSFYANAAIARHEK